MIFLSWRWCQVPAADEAGLLYCQFLPAIIHIGNEDIRSVIQNAIVNSKKLWNPVAEGRVGASGVFNCQTGIIGRWEAVRWSIYWDPKVPSPQDQPR